MTPPTFVPGFHDDEASGNLRYSRLGKTHMVVSNLGLGGSAFASGAFADVSDELACKIVVKALKSGVNYIDTAPWYGQRKSEEVIGNALQGVPRSAYYIATKIGRYDLDKKTMFDFTREKTLWSVDKSLELLKTGYLDLVQIHDVEFCCNLEQIIHHTLPTLLELKSQGKVRAIGVNSYNVGLLKKIVRLTQGQQGGGFDTVLSYSRLTLFNDDLSSELDFFRSRGVGVINAAPVGMGLLSPGNTPAWHPAPEVTKRVARRAAEYCAQRKISLPLLAVKWSLARPDVPTCVVSVTSEEILQENLTAAAGGEMMTQEEEEMIRQVRERFFDFMTCSQWENLEVAKYWARMEENGWEQKSDC